MHAREGHFSTLNTRKGRVTQQRHSRVPPHSRRAVRAAGGSTKATRGRRRTRACAGARFRFECAARHNSATWVTAARCAAHRAARAPGARACAQRRPVHAGPGCPGLRCAARCAALRSVPVRGSCAWLWPFLTGCRGKTVAEASLWGPPRRRRAPRRPQRRQQLRARRAAVGGRALLQRRPPTTEAPRSSPNAHACPSAVRRRRSQSARGSLRTHLRTRVCAFGQASPWCSRPPRAQHAEREVGRECASAESRDPSWCSKC
jgi:hypothetical protein